MDGGYAFLDVQLPWLSLGVLAVPVEEAEGGVAGLLDFGQEDAAADGVDGAGGEEQAVAGARGKGGQAFGHGSFFEGGAKLLRADAGEKARVDLAVRFGVDDKPRFGLRSFAGPELDRKSTRLNSSHIQKSRMPSSA